MAPGVPTEALRIHSIQQALYKSGLDVSTNPGKCPPSPAFFQLGTFERTAFWVTSLESGGAINPLASLPAYVCFLRCPLCV